MNTLKKGKVYPHCPKCGQAIRSEERLKNHLARCLGTGKHLRRK